MTNKKWIGHILSAEWEQQRLFICKFRHHHKLFIYLQIQELSDGSRLNPKMGIQGLWINSS